MDGLINAYNNPKATRNRRAYTQQEQRLIPNRCDKQQARSPSAKRTGSTSSSNSSSTDSSASVPTVSIERRSNSNPLPSMKSLAFEQQIYNSGINFHLDAFSMETLMARTTQIANTSTSSLHSEPPPLPNKVYRTPSEEQDHILLSNPFQLRHGRRYLKDVPYPLPVDLAEIQRQNMRTLLSISVLGRPVCSPRWETEAPEKVLEVGCGGGYWSAMAHDHFSERGAPDVEFVGLDLAPVATDLRQQGVNWKFVQHDLRRIPLPFDDEEFDLVVIKDLSLVMSFGQKSERVLEDCIRLVKCGGSIEIWDSDHILRSLQQDAPPPAAKRMSERKIAEETATYSVAPGHGFTPAQNPYLQTANRWISDALDRRKLLATPCMRIAELILQEPKLTEIGQRRVAVPLGELRWEKSRQVRNVSDPHDSPLSGSWSEKSCWIEKTLTADQTALRQTALLTVLQQIESMEPMLRQVSGKNWEEWSHWWASMMSDLLDPSQTILTGECLELGAWWATKKMEDE